MKLVKGQLELKTQGKIIYETFVLIKRGTFQTQTEGKYSDLLNTNGVMWIHKYIILTFALYTYASSHSSSTYSHNMPSIHKLSTSLSGW